MNLTTTGTGWCELCGKSRRHPDHKRCAAVRKATGTYSKPAPKKRTRPAASFEHVAKITGDLP